MFQKYYSKFIQANPGVQHYAAHSHHYWPDVSFQATEQYWLDSARLIDDKWDYIFSEKVPLAQRLICEVLNLSKPEQIVFAPNTHELVYRLLSCFLDRKNVSVLTTDSEFHSFERQINRLSEPGEGTQFQVTKVSTQNFESFEEQFIEKINTEKFDLIFLSHVFFNSGHVVADLKKIVEAVRDPNTLIAIDGYHGFMALPTDLREIEDRIFYISGSYKYAQGGEGCCFMWVPPNCTLRPSYTGWFASFQSLSQKNMQVQYSADAYRFAGATMDFTALYRLISVLELFKNEKINVLQIHEHILKLQKNFLLSLNELAHQDLNQQNIVNLGQKQQAHFFAFELKDAEKTLNIYKSLKSKKIITDFRGTRLRFGFGLYQNEHIDFTDWLKNGAKI